MTDLLRDSMFGQLVRAISGKKLFRYPEEHSDFGLPSDYDILHGTAREKEGSTGSNLDTSTENEDDNESEVDTGLATPSTTAHQVRPTMSRDGSTDQTPYDLSKIFSASEIAAVTTRADLEQAYSRATERERLSRGPSVIINPSKTADGITLVDWYTSDDPANPHNWSSGKKSIVTVQI